MPKREIPRVKIELWLPAATVDLVKARASSEGVRYTKWLNDRLPALLESVTRPFSTRELASQVHCPVWMKENSV
jgi:hypothetical protein